MASGRILWHKVDVTPNNMILKKSISKKTESFYGKFGKFGIKACFERIDLKKEGKEKVLHSRLG